MKKISLLISTIALLLSAISLCVSYSQPAVIKIDWAAFLIGILSLLVTSLIGWQIYNYIYVKREMKALIEKEMHDSMMDVMHVLKGIVSVSNSRSFFMSRMAQSLDDNMIALEEIQKSKNLKLNQYAIEFIMDNMHNIKNAMPSIDGYVIYDGCKSKYLYLLKDVDNQYTNEMMQMINQAEEIPNKRNNDLRVSLKGTSEKAEAFIEPLASRSKMIKVSDSIS